MEKFKQYFNEVYGSDHPYRTPEMIEAFAKVHNQQRWEGPEGMFNERLNPNVTHGTGSWLYWLEHGGDLIHRSSYSDSKHDFGGGGYHYGRRATLEKAEKIYQSLAPRKGWMPIDEDVKQQIESNYNYHVREYGYKGSLEQWWKEVREAGERYSQAYEKLQPVTEVQKLGRDVAIHIGRFQFKEAVPLLAKLIKLLKSKDWVTHYWTPLNTAPKPFEENKI